jgi:hypothetical protein
MTIEAAVRPLEEKIGPLERVIRLFAAGLPPPILEKDEEISAFRYAKPQPNRMDEVP